MESKPKLTAKQAEAILFEYPDADLSGFEVDGDVEALAIMATGRALSLVDSRMLASKRNEPC